MAPLGATRLPGRLGTPHGLERSSGVWMFGSARSRLRRGPVMAAMPSAMAGMTAGTSPRRATGRRGGRGLLTGVLALDRRSVLAENPVTRWVRPGVDGRRTDVPSTRPGFAGRSDDLTDARRAHCRNTE